MSLGPVLNDDYVAEILLRDAQINRNQRGTAASHLSSLKDRARRPDVSKPNTTFLRNIIRDTDSHNAALKAREQQESRDRLRQLSEQNARRKRKRDQTGDSGDNDTVRRTKVREPLEREGRWRAALGGLVGDSSRSRVKDWRQRTRDTEDTEVRSRRRESRAGDSSDHMRQSGSNSHDYRKVNRRRHRPPYNESELSRSRDEVDLRRRRRSNDQHSRSSFDSYDDDDDDCRSVGPEPPPTTLPRGRGAFRLSSIDSRFRPDYDPKLDVEPELDAADAGDDWDMALEAIKDRARWRTKGADRLRAAGFTDEEVRRWERGGEKDADDVRWRKKGEGREWDRGKKIETG